MENIRWISIKYQSFINIYICYIIIIFCTIQNKTILGYSWGQSCGSFVLARLRWRSCFRPGFRLAWNMRVDHSPLRIWSQSLSRDWRCWMPIPGPPGGASSRNWRLVFQPFSARLWNYELYCHVHVQKRKNASLASHHLRCAAMFFSKPKKI